MFQLKLFFSIIFLIYTLSIGYYTIYGISKSYIEYFCTQERPGPPIHQSRSLIEELTLPIGRIGHGDTHTVIYNDGTLKVNFIGDNTSSSYIANEICRDFKWEEKDKNSVYGVSDFNFHKCEGNSTSFNFLYKIEDEFFSAECGFAFLDKARVINDCRYVEPSARELQSGDCKTSNEDNFAIYCVFTKSFKTCDIPLQVQNKFFKFYLISFSIISTICLFSIFTSTFHDMMIIRILSRIYRLFTSFGTINLKSPFCNPITGQAVYLKEGEKYTSFCVHGDYEQLPEGDCPFFTDNDGTYFISGDTLFLFDKENGNNSFKIDEQVKMEISRYFSLIVKDPRLCVTNGENHYLKTKEAIRRMVLGETIKIHRAQNSRVITDVSEFDVKRVMCMFNIDQEITKFLLEHNRRFFKKILIEPLILCLKKKVFFDSRPKNVGNAAWKWYTSDFSQIMKRRGSQYFSQVKWRKSSALIAVENTEKIEIIKCEDVPINVDLKQDLIQEYTHKGVDRLLKFGFESERDFFIGDEKLILKVHKTGEVELEEAPVLEDPSSSKMVPNVKHQPSSYEDLKKEKNIHKIKTRIDENLKEREDILDKMEIKLTGYADAVKRNKIELETAKKEPKTKIELVPNNDYEKEKLKSLEKVYDRWVKKNKPEIIGNSTNNEKIRKSKEIFENLSNEKEREQIINFKKVKVAVESSIKPVDKIEYIVNRQAIREILDPYLKCRNYYECIADMLNDDGEILKEIKETKVSLKVDDVIDIFKKKGRYKKPTMQAAKKIATKKKRIKITHNKFKKVLFKINDFEDIKALEQKEMKIMPFKELNPEIKKVFYLTRVKLAEKNKETSEKILDIFEKLTMMEGNSIKVTKSHLERLMGDKWPNLLYILTHLE